MDLVRHWEYVRNMMVLSLSFAGLVVYFQISPFIFEKQYGLSPTAYSWLSLVIAFTYLLGTISVRRQLKKYSMNRIILHGVLFSLLGGLLIIAMQLFNLVSMPAILIASMIYVFGLRLIFPSATANCLDPFKESAGSAAALLGAILMAVTSLVSFLTAMIPIDQVLLLGLSYAILSLVSLVFVVRRRFLLLVPSI